jgi:hypothetical protein
MCCHVCGLLYLVPVLRLLHELPLAVANHACTLCPVCAVWSVVASCKPLVVTQWLSLLPLHPCHNMLPMWRAGYTISCSMAAGRLAG